MTHSRIGHRQDCRRLTGPRGLLGQCVVASVQLGHQVTDKIDSRVETIVGNSVDKAGVVSVGSTAGGFRVSLGQHAAGDDLLDLVALLRARYPGMGTDELDGLCLDCREERDVRVVVVGATTQL